MRASPCQAAWRVPGPQKALSDEQAATLRQRATAGEPKAQLAREFNISRETLYQYLRTDD